jgi:polyferredoxin
MRFQRLAQGACLAIFLALLGIAGINSIEYMPVDIFLRMDPVVGIGTTLASREIFFSLLLPGIIVLLVTVVFGRLFCGYVCPMGTTLDLVDSAFFSKRRKKNRSAGDKLSKDYSHRKYVFLSVIIGSAICGVSIVYWGSPLSIVTRFYSLVVYPLLSLVFEQALGLTSPLQDWLPGVVSLEISQKVFATNVFVAALFIGISCLALLQPRFWCRNLCPAGAILAIFSRTPIVRRNVGEACNNCGKCSRECPSGAISDEPGNTRYSECLACLKCLHSCPQNAIKFSAVRGVPEGNKQNLFYDRRNILLGIGAGMLTAGLFNSNLTEQKYPVQEKPLRDSLLIRPPGSIPEKDFTERCIRCGECMRACPTNTLQPIWLLAGLQGLFSPIVTARLAGCALNCNSCGKVCPTGAIRCLPLEEKIYAKIGTAWIERRNCLVWEQDKKCLVCDEVCPYNAISFRPSPDHTNAVPVVIENRCSGCGWCESKCPVEGASAIRVNIIGEIRMTSGSYAEKAQEFGLEFRSKDNSSDSIAPDTFLSPDGPFDEPHQ